MDLTGTLANLADFGGKKKPGKPGGLTPKPAAKMHKDAPALLSMLGGTSDVPAGPPASTVAPPSPVVAPGAPGTTDVAAGSPGTVVAPQTPGAAVGTPDADPGAAHFANAKGHFENARKAWLQRNATAAPTPMHAKTGLGLMFASLLMGALDPTHRAGEAALQAGQQVGQNQADDRFAGQQAAYNQNQAGLTDQGNLEAQQANQENQLGQSAQADAQTSAQNTQGQANWQQQFNAGQTQNAQQVALQQQELAQKKQDGEDRQVEADFQGYLKAAGSTDPTIRNMGYAGILSHMGHNRAALERMGWNVDDLQQQVMEAAGHKTPAQLLQESLTGVHTAQAAQTTAMTPQMVAKTKAEVDYIKAETGYDDAKAAQVHELLKWLPLEEQAKVAKLGAETDHLREEIRTSKTVDPNDKRLRSTLNGIDFARKGYDKQVEGLVSQQKGLEGLMKKHDKGAAARSAEIDEEIKHYRRLSLHLTDQGNDLIKLVASKVGG